MGLFTKEKSLIKACRRELRAVAKREAAIARAAGKTDAAWKAALAEMVPEKVHAGLRAAFTRAFALLIEKVTPLLDKTLDRTALSDEYRIGDYAVHLKASRKALRRMRRDAGRAALAGSAVTALEGIGLGALGIGMPDIALFLGILMRSTLSTAARWGFNGTSPGEQLLILRMMEASLSRDADFIAADAAVDALLTAPCDPSPEEMQAQIGRTAEVFAVDMLAAKFIQGLPLIGIAGGLSDPVCYNKVMRYVRLKYYKRYLLRLAAEQK